MSPLCMNQDMRTVQLSVRSFDICNLRLEQSVVRNIESTATLTALWDTSVVFFFFLLPTVSRSLDLSQRCCTHRNKHSKKARKNTNKKLLHLIQIAFKCVGYMSQFFTKHFNRRTMRNAAHLRHTVLTVPCDALQRFDLVSSRCNCHFYPLFCSVPYFVSYSIQFYIK